MEGEKTLERGTKSSEELNKELLGATLGDAAVETGKLFGEALLNPITGIGELFRIFF
ncbi:hypothetical protein DOJK_01690 [Patescibacteria group bacterium]|jgi:hypothetical protein|nr:hypothetical protein DOJK_01690 [Patescibacteria group bacterium]